MNKKITKFMGRASQLALAATRLALEDAQLSMSDLSQHRIGLCLGTTLGEIPSLEKIDKGRLRDGNCPIDRPSIFQFPVTNMFAYTAREYKLRAPVKIFTTACAAGNYAIGSGYDLIQEGEADIVIAGGADPFSWIAYTGFDQFRSIAHEKCQPFDKNRKGMLVSEGAGMLVLETLEQAQLRNCHIYAEILGYGLSCDAFHMTNTQTDGIYQCMKNALVHADISPEAVDYIAAHGTGTKYNDRAETMAIKRLFKERTREISVSSIKSMLGHTMGAASALGAISCCMALEYDLIPPTVNFETYDPECDIDCVPNTAKAQRIDVALNNGFAFGGNNASLVLKKFVDSKGGDR
jgi:3-oxoacyl-[acyl-carrier-protein] synthase II